MMTGKAGMNNIKDDLGTSQVKNPPSNAGDLGLTLSWGTKIPPAMGQLSLCTTTTESM